MAVDYTAARRRGARARRLEGAEASRAALRLDPLRLGRRARRVRALASSTGITRDDVAGEPRLLRDPPGGLRRRRGAAMLGASLLDPDLYRRYWRQLYAVTLGLLAARDPAGAERARVAALDRRRLVHVPAVGVREAPRRPRARGVPRGARAADRRSAHGARRRSGSPRCRSLLVFIQPDIGTALVYGAALVAMLFIAGARWLHLGVILSTVALTGMLVVWLLPAAGVDVLKPYQRDRLTAFVNRSHDPQRRDATTSSSRSSRSARAGSRPRRRRTRRRPTSTTCRSTRPTSRSPRSPSSAASSARRSCSCSTCSSSGAACASSRTPPTRTRRSSPAGSCSRSCSRSSSTSA